MGISVSGMVSGMDIDGIVAKMMSAARQPLDRLEQSKTKYEWQRDAYREVNKGIKELSTKIFDGIGMQKNLLARKGTSSNESAISVTPLAGASQETVMMSVQQLANAKTYVGKELTNGVSTEKMGSVGELKFKVTNGEGKEQTVSISYGAEDTLDKVLDKMNNNKDLNMSVFYDSGTKKVVLTARDTGSKTEIQFADSNTAEAMKKFGFSDSSGSALSTDKKLSELTDGTNKFQLANTGNDAKFTINGLETTRSSNEFTINGMAYNLKQTTATGEVVTISTTHDVDKAVDTIKDFVESYNALIGTMDKMVKQDRYKDFAPLTEEQKKEMSDDQIKKLEEKAKSGILRSDSILRQGLDEMIGDLSRAVGGTTLAKFGITTSSKYNKEKGKLLIDENKLRAALAEDPEAVYNAFNEKTSADITAKNRWDRSSVEQSKFEKESGFATRIRDALSNLSYNIERKAGNEGSVLNSYSIGKNVVDINKKITSMEKRLESLQTRYYNQFAAMERAMQQAQSQSAYIGNIFGQAQ